MFSFRALELVHWDYWQRFTIPLDGSIVTVVGPNGSGKTTLLDALRTLLAIDCSSGRDYKRYVRHADQPYAWLRAVVDNPRRASSGGQFAFWPITTPRVTLLCQILKKAGEWQRHYAIGENEVMIDDQTEAAVEWLGVRQYEAQLEGAGLTRAIKRVLALDQGHTDKLCEYNGRQLLDLVFDVFGDAQVLQNYGKAREEQKAVERELEDLRTRLAQLGTQLRQAESDVNSYHDYLRLLGELADLHGQWLPRVQLAERSETIKGGRSQSLGKRREFREAGGALLRAEAAHAAHAGERDAADADEESCKRILEDVQKDERSLLKSQGRPAGVLQAREELLKRAAVQRAGFDLQAESARQERLGRERYLAEQTLAARRAEAEELALRIAAFESGKPPESRDVTAFRAALQDAGIAHRMLADIIEIADDAWQPAIEAVLQGVRHIVLLDHSADRERAWSLGERLRYRHFITPDRGEAPPTRSGSLLETLSFKSPPPLWLARVLNDIQRVPDIAAGSRLPPEQAWITPGGYQRERRGARDASVAEFHFGRTALAQAKKRALALKDDIEAAQTRLRRTVDALVAVQSLLAGVDAARELSAREPEFEQARLEVEALAAQAETITNRREAAAQAYSDAIERSKTAGTTATTAALRRDSKREEQRRIEQEFRTARRAYVDNVLAWRSLRHGKPLSWRSVSALVEAKARYGNVAAVEREIERQQKRRDESVFVTDANCEPKLAKLTLDHDAMAGRIEQQAHNLERAKASTDRARGQYLNVLKATMRRYADNLRRLGALAGIGIDVVYPDLGNDDLSLAQARLEVQFNFDQKGLIGLNDGEASGGQQVMKSMILLVGLMMEDDRGGGFVFIDEPFAHLDIFNIDKVGAFLQATRAQYIVTTPNTHNVNVFQPSELTLLTQKRAPGTKWAPPVAFLRRARQNVT